MSDRNPTASGASDLLLVFGATAFVLGLVLMSRGEPSSHLAAAPKPAAHASPVPAETSVIALDDHPAGGLSVPDGALPTTMPLPPFCGRVAFTGECPLRNDLDQDLRLVLADMALQQRGIAAHYAASGKQYGAPATDEGLSADPLRAVAEGSAAHAEASPWTARRPIGTGC